MSREQAEHYIASIMDRFEGDGGTADYVAHVLEHDGGLDRYRSEIARAGLEEMIRRLIRTERLPEHGNVRRYASVKTQTGEMDSDGNQIERRVYVPAQHILFDREDYACNQVVDFHIGRSHYHEREANLWVTQRRIATNGEYQRALPFPDLELVEE